MGTQDTGQTESANGKATVSCRNIWAPAPRGPRLRRVLSRALGCVTDHPQPPSPHSRSQCLHRPALSSPSGRLTMKTHHPASKQSTPSSSSSCSQASRSSSTASSSPTTRSMHSSRGTFAFLPLSIPAANAHRKRQICQLCWTVCPDRFTACSG